MESASLRIREAPEDFFVEEIPLYPPSGEGGHTFVFVEKRLRTTEEVAGSLAALACVKSGDVGYAGRKDRVAVTRQWFSVPGLSPERALGSEIEGAVVLQAVPHGHKLRTGQLKGNRFRIRVRGTTSEIVQRVRGALEVAEHCGVPNRFGNQRFGSAGDNAARGLAILRGEARPRKRREARFLVSALQSQVFNEVLRTRPLSLDRVELGDVAVVVESGGLFVVEDEARENERVSRFEISPTGPIFGRKVTQPTGEPAAREAAVHAMLGVPAPSELNPPPGLRLRGARRSLRVIPANTSIREDADSLTIGFDLPAGSYATVMLEELLGPSLSLT
jgi:tRNA pseudouridine13 synthase